MHGLRALRNFLVWAQVAAGLVADGPAALTIPNPALLPHRVHHANQVVLRDVLQVCLPEQAAPVWRPIIYMARRQASILLRAADLLGVLSHIKHLYVQSVPVVFVTLRKT